MRRDQIIVILGILLALPVRAMEFEAPPAPESAAQLLPKEADSFGEGLWNVVRAAAVRINPSLTEAVSCCLRVFAAVLLTAMVGQFAPGISKNALELAGVAAVAVLLLEPSASLIEMGVQTVRELRDYGKLLLGVMASALAARGGVTASTALYVGTAFFDTLLGAAVTALFVPMLWMYLALSIAYGAVGEAMLDKLRQFIRWLMEWALKLTLYIFTGYMAITGVGSGDLFLPNQQKSFIVVHSQACIEYAGKLFAAEFGKCSAADLCPIQQGLIRCGPNGIDLPINLNCKAKILDSVFHRICTGAGRECSRIAIQRGRRIQRNHMEVFDLTSMPMGADTQCLVIAEHRRVVVKGSCVVVVTGYRKNCRRSLFALSRTSFFLPS